MSDEPQQGREPTEEELRAALEEQLDQIPVAEVALDAAVSLLNLGARRLGLAGDTERGVDPAQGRTAIEAVRALLGVLESQLDEQRMVTMRDALSQLQLAYTRLVSAGAGAGEQAGEGAAGAQPADPSEPPGSGPAQSSGRLWVPGQ